MYVPLPILHERLPDAVERIENDLAFQTLMDPHDIGEYEPIVPYRDAARRMRKIVHQLRTSQLDK